MLESGASRGKGVWGLYFYGELMKKFSIVIFALLGGACMVARAELKTERIDYKQGDVVLEGFLAYDDSFSGKRPGILVVHQE